jgi:DNA-binding XRE family transcriptional regulator
MNLNDAIDISLSVARRIQEVRNWSGLKQKDFAERLGVSRSYMSEVEARKRKPNIEMLVGIANTFDEIRPEWLLTGTGGMLKKDRLQSDSDQCDLDSQAVAVVIHQYEGILKNVEKDGQAPSLHAKASLISWLYKAYMDNYRQQLTAQIEHMLDRNNPEELDTCEKLARVVAANNCGRLSADLERDWLNTAIGIGPSMPMNKSAGEGSQ